MDMKWYKQEYPKYLIYSSIEDENKYVYYINLINSKYELSVINFGDAKELPKIDIKFNSEAEAKSYAEIHYQRYVLGKNNV